MMNSMKKKKQPPATNPDGSPSQGIGGGINNPGADCISETIVNNLNIIGDNAINLAQNAAQSGGGGGGGEQGGAAAIPVHAEIYV